MSTLAGPLPRDLRRSIRDWRRGRAELSWGEVIGDAYVVLLAVLVYGSMLVSAVVNAGRAVAACTTAACSGARAGTPVLVVLALVVAVVAGIALLGPVVASRATSAIVLATPVDRGRWLRRQLLVVLAVLLAVGAVLGLLVAVPAGWSPSSAGMLGASSGLVLVLAYAAGVLAQAERPAWWRASVWLPALALVAALAVVALDGLDGLRPPSSPVWWLVPGGLLVVAVPLVVLADHRLGRLRRRDLIRGHGLARGLAGALAGLDPALAYDVVLEQSSARRAHVRVVRGGLRGAGALLGADLHRLRRYPLRLLPLAGTVVVPYALASAGAGALLFPVVVVAGFWAALPFGAGTRVLARTPGLGRLLGRAPVVLRSSALALPTLLLLLLGLASTGAQPGPALVDDLLLGLAVGLAAAASMARWLMAAPPDYSRPLLSTPMGAAPTALYSSIVRGFDVALLASIPVLFVPTAVGAVISLVLSGTVLAVLVTSKDR